MAAVLFAAGCGGAPAKPSAKAPVAGARHDETSPPIRSATSAVVDEKGSELTVQVIVRDTCQIHTVEEVKQFGKPTEKREVGTPREVPCGEHVKTDQALVLVAGDKDAQLAPTDAQGVSKTSWDTLSAAFLEGATPPEKAEVHVGAKTGEAIASVDLAAARAAAADRAWALADQAGTVRAVIAFGARFPGAHTADVQKRIGEKGDAEMNAAVGAALDAGNLVAARQLLDEWKALIPAASPQRTQRQIVIESREQIARVDVLLADIATQLAANATAADPAALQKAAADATELAKLAPADKRATDAQKKVADARKQTARKFSAQASAKLAAKDFAGAGELQAKAEQILPDDREVVAMHKAIERNKAAADAAVTAKQKAEEAKAAREAERVAKEEAAKQKAEEARQKAEADKAAREAERQAKLDEQKRKQDEAKAKAEADRQAKLDEAAKKAEGAKQKAEEAKAKAEADRQAKADAERAKKEADAAAKAEADRKKQEAEAAAKAEAQKKKDDAIAEQIRKKAEADAKKNKGKVAAAPVAVAPAPRVAVADDAKTTHALVGVWATTAKANGSTIVMLFNAAASGAGNVTVLATNGRVLARQNVTWQVIAGSLEIAGGEKLALHGGVSLQRNALTWSGHHWQRVRGRTVLAQNTPKPEAPPPPPAQEEPMTHSPLLMPKGK